MTTNPTPPQAPTAPHAAGPNDVLAQRVVALTERAEAAEAQVAAVVRLWLEDGAKRSPVGDVLAHELYIDDGDEFGCDLVDRLTGAIASLALQTMRNPVQAQRIDPDPRLLNDALDAATVEDVVPGVREVRTYASAAVDFVCDPDPSDADEGGTEPLCGIPGCDCGEV